MVYQATTGLRRLGPNSHYYLDYKPYERSGTFWGTKSFHPEVDKSKIWYNEEQRCSSWNLNTIPVQSCTEHEITLVFGLIVCHIKLRQSHFHSVLSGSMKYPCETYPGVWKWTSPSTLQECQNLQEPEESLLLQVKSTKKLIREHIIIEGHIPWKLHQQHDHRQEMNILFFCSQEGPPTFCYSCHHNIWAKRKKKAWLVRTYEIGRVSKEQVIAWTIKQEHPFSFHKNLHAR